MSQSSIKLQSKSPRGPLPSLPSSAAAQSALPSGQQQRHLQDNLAQLKKMKASCADVANQAMAGYSEFGASVATLPWEGSPRLSTKKARGIRQGNHFPSPDEVTHRICPARAKPSFFLFLQSSSCDRSGIPDEVARSSDLFSAIRRVVFSTSLGPRDFGCRTAGHRNGGRTAGEAHAYPRREFAVGPFSQKGAKETKELSVLSSLIPDCRLTAGALFREASVHDPRNLPSSARWLPTGGHQQISGRLCVLSRKRMITTWFITFVCSRMGVLTSDEAQSLFAVPTFGIECWFLWSCFVACGKELLFLGAFWSPLFQHFSQCKTPSASQAGLAAVAGTLMLFGNALAVTEWVSLFMQTVCLQFSLRVVFVLPKLAQSLLISRARTLCFCFHSTFLSTFSTCLRTKATLATSLQTFWQARLLHLIPLPSGLTGAWISICLFLTIWLRRNFGLLLSILMIPCASQEACHHRYCQCSHRAPCASSAIGCFPLFCSQAPAFALFRKKNGSFGWCSRIQMWRNVSQVFSLLRISLFGCDTARSGRLRVVGLFGCCDDEGPLFASCGPAQAHGHALASWLHVSCNSSSCSGQASW